MGSHRSFPPVGPNTHNAALRLLAIPAEIKVLERLLRELDYATYPHKIEDYFSQQEAQRLMEERNRLVRSGAYLNCR